MQLLMAMMLLAQPPAVPDGPPVVPELADLEIATRLKAEPDDSFRVYWLDSSTFTRASRIDSVTGDLGNRVNISGPWHNGRFVIYATLSSPSIEQVKAALAKARATWAAEKAVSQTAAPKGWPLPSAGETVEPDLERRGPWPSDLTFPDGMQRYKRAAYTQEIAVTNGRDRITPIERIALHVRDARWLVSGGLLGTDFRSDLYRNAIAANAREYTDDITVSNGGDVTYFDGFRRIIRIDRGVATQENRGWRREFPDGSRLMDVLSSAGKVFEVRQRLKEAGKWKSSVLFEDEKARPKGYTGLTVSCASCHNAKDGPGTGPYAGPLVTGSDSTFSVPFHALEK